MGIAKGYTTIGGWVKSTTWNTPIAVGAGEGLRFTSVDGGADIQLIESEELSGDRNRLPGDRGNLLNAPTLNCEMLYEGIERVIAQAMGTAVAPVQQGSDDAYLHAFQQANELDGIHGTMIRYHSSKPVVQEWTTAKVNGFTFTVGASNQRATIAFPLIAASVNWNEGSGTNNNTTAGSVTFPSNRDFVNFAHMAVRLNDTTAGALGASDIVYPSELTITVNNNLPTDDVTTAYAPYTDEPIGGGFGEVSVSMSFTKGVQDITRLNDMISTSAVQKKMDVVFTGPVADGATNYSLTFYFPSLQFTGTLPAPEGPDRIPEALEFTGHRVGTVPTGFPAGYDDAVTIEIVNQRNSTALA